jgi:peptide/nickel transport system substrate-binding protein
MRKHPVRIAIALLVTVVLLGSFSGCKKPEPPPPPGPVSGGELIMGLASDIMARGGMDPAGTTTVPNLVVCNNIYDNLFYMDTDGSIKLGILDSYTVSPDTKVFTFKIRSGIKFHDGTTLDAEAVKFMFDRIVDPANALPAKASLGPFDKCVVKDASTVEVHFKEPFAAFINNLTMYNFGVPSPTAVQKYGKDFAQNPVGSGPFIFKTLVPAQSLTLERNPDYNWAPKGMYEHTGPAYLDKITFKFIPEEVPRMGALETGVCNAVVYLSGDGLARFRAEPAKYKVTIVPVPCVGFSYYLNSEKFPTNDVAVRQAMLWAVDQPKMAEALYKGVLTPALGVFSPAMMGYDKRIDEMYSYNPAKAKEILEAAGWKLGADGVRSKDGKRLVVDLATLEGSRYSMAAEWMQAELKEVGIEAKLSMMASSARLEAGKTGSHNGVQMGAQANDPDVLRTLFHSTQIGADNYSRIQDAELDAWLVEAAQTTDIARRKDLYFKAQEKIRQQALLLPIYNTTHAFAQSTKVTGLRMDGTGYYPLLYDCKVAK